MALLSFVLLLAQAGAKAADAPPNLATYLKLHPEVAGLAVSAEERTPLKTGAGLARYNRKAIRIGTVNAIVPVNMVVFDDSLRQSPNLYDGLPRESKVLYLLTLLRPDQMQKVARTGLGLNDLRGEARQVLASILPKSVKWTKERLGNGASYGDSVGKGELSDAQTQGMRLKVERQLQFEIPLADGSNAYTFHDVSEEAGSPGETVLLRDADDEFEREASYGVTIQKTVPNVPKPGELDTARLGATVTLPPQTTVGEATALAGRASGREILADLRVRDRKVTSPGGRMRAGDLLDALALAVEGTYRRVGSEFMLVSDVTGLGARKLRLALWEGDLDLQLRQREGLWRRALAASGTLASVDYDEEGGLAPSPAMLKSMADRRPEDYNRWPSTSEFTPEIRAFLERINLRYPTQKVDTTRARANWEMRYRFVDAEGDSFQTEFGSLGRDMDFEGNRFERPRNLEASAPKPTLDPANGVGLAVAVRTPSEATAALALARRYGFGELWLDTTAPETLRAALAMGFPVRLMIHPWAASEGDDPAQFDRSILGDTASQAAARVDRSEATVAAARGPVRTGWERDPIPKDPTDVLSPDAPILPARWAALQALAGTPGLRGVLVLAARPHGYEGDAEDRGRGAERQELLDITAMGYGETARLAFARAHALDPIDLADRGLMFSADLRPPFFLDDALRGSFSVYDGTQTPIPAMETLPKEWAKRRASTNESALAKLVRGISANPLWVESGHVEQGRWRTLSTWNPSGLATAPTGRGRMGDAIVLALPATEGEGRQMPLGTALSFFARPQTFARALDLGRLSQSEWERRLGLWLSPRPSEPTHAVAKP